MRFLVKFCALLAALSMPLSVLASPDIVGTWEIQSFTRITKEGKELPWCMGVHGLLTYTADGFVSWN